CQVTSNKSFFSIARNSLLSFLNLRSPPPTPEAPQMTRSLKDSYRLQLFAALAANLALYYALVNGLSTSDLRVDAFSTHLNTLLPGGLAVALCGILNAQLTYLQKARIVFLRWRDPLPGCRAFSHYASRDPRIDMKAVRAKWSPLPKGAQQQNALWYRI